MIFSSVFFSLIEPSVNNTLLALLKNAPVVFFVMAFFMVWVVCWLPLAAISAFILNLQLNKPLQPEQKIPLLVSLYLLVPFILWGINWLGLGSFANYGLVGNISILRSLWLGLGLGVLGLVIVFTCQFWLGWCYLEKSNIKLIPGILLPISLVALFVGGIEELLFRGFLLITLEKDYPIWLAAIISSLIFALLHLVWEQKETIPQLPGLWLMGMVLVLARLADGGSLGIAWGLHAGWVWAIATIDTAGLITYTGKVSEWVTGKNKKPLAGLAGVLCVLVTGIILWWFVEI
ncbi:MAG: lysostaphin resistance A-like protein [Sphaerospermopsis kisseleviana]|uniref:Type II CAAX endopeptidase family protein n=1 Tax=Sphaerospermopsis kisseleviana CS-549 TaxID=3021783 RepID=A0ABT4ZUI6_9CYAN|nr:type II CAAX endopeptidase family protein [Sphaerospermopsis kisseleviana]MBD2134663.1 CPBP family intramembrane metalloprotease [Sphaerospermopsis sp. FACHB-1094]MDB9442939.1 type II CAAX endopeptidase family protein [Sphaerospermopsis kisseleviana CS-549]